MKINFKKIVVCSIVFTMIIMPRQIFAIDDEDYIWSRSIETNTKLEEKNIEENSLNLESGAAVLIDQSIGQILYENNCHEQLRPASVTKVMTILLIMEAIDRGEITLDTKIPCSENAAAMGGSQIWLDVREELTVNEMLKAICVVSANEYKVRFWH